MKLFVVVWEIKWSKLLLIRFALSLAHSSELEGVIYSDYFRDKYMFLIELVGEKSLIKMSYANKICLLLSYGAYMIVSISENLILLLVVSYINSIK